MKIHARGIALAPLSALMLLLASCSPRAILTVTNDGAGNAAFDTDMSTTAENVVRRFTGAEANLFDGEEIKASLSRAEIKVDSVTFPKQSSIALALSFPKLDGLLEKSVAFSKTGRSMTISISADSLRAAMGVMPASVNDYLDLLMAPVFTGEKLTQAEYVDVIRSAYGKTLADELEKSAFTLTVRCPEPIKSAKIDASATYAKEGKQAVFRIPLAALLAMEKPLQAKTEW